MSQIPRDMSVRAMTGKWKTATALPRRKRSVQVIGGEGQCAGRATAMYHRDLTNLVPSTQASVDAKPIILCVTDNAKRAIATITDRCPLNVTQILEPVNAVQV